MYNIYEIFYLIAVYKSEAANTVYSSWWWAVCRSKHVEPSINFWIINSITRLHHVGYFYWFKHLVIRIENASLTNTQSMGK